MQNSRNLKDIKVDVITHDLEALGLRLIALSKSVSPGCTQQDLWAVVRALIDVRERLNETESVDLVDLIDNTPNEDDIPF